MNNNIIAVIIPIKNEMEGLSELVKSLLSQSMPPDEIIFTDAGSTDGSAEILKTLAGEYKQIKYISAPGAFPGAGRNIAIQNTTANIIAQIDGGNLPENEWLEMLCRPILTGEADYVIGNIKIMPVWKYFFGFRFNIGEVYGASIYRELRTEKSLDGGASVAYSREVWENVGGFMENLRGGEDRFFAEKVAKSKVRIAFVSNAYIYWQIGPSLRDIIKRQIYYQMAKFRKHHTFSKYRRTFLLPLLFIFMGLIAFFFRFFWVIILASASLYWLLRCRNVLKIHNKRSPAKKSLRETLFVSGTVAFIEFIHIFSKIIGTAYGLTELKRRRISIKEIDNYLNYTDG